MIQNQLFKFSNHLKFESPYYLNAAQISDDEKFLAIGGMAKKIQIFHLKNTKLIKNIILDSQIIKFQFSKNSNILHCGVGKGYLHGYDIMNNFKLIYEDKLHQERINDIITIDDELILTCTIDSIQITNIKQKEQLLKIQNLDQYIYAVDYYKSRDCIIYQNYTEIIFINRKDGEVQIKYVKAHQGFTNQIQLFSNGNNLVSSCGYHLFLWQIDYDNRTLIMVKHFNHRHFNFTSILNNSKLVLILQKCIQIIDNNFVLIKQINHNIQDKLCNYYVIQQIISTRYNQIPQTILQSEDEGICKSQKRELEKINGRKNKQMNIQVNIIYLSKSNEQKYPKTNQLLQFQVFNSFFFFQYPHQTQQMTQKYNEHLYQQQIRVFELAILKQFFGYDLNLIYNNLIFPQGLSLLYLFIIIFHILSKSSIQSQLNYGEKFWKKREREKYLDNYSNPYIQAKNKNYNSEIIFIEQSLLLKSHILKKVKKLQKSTLGQMIYEQQPPMQTNLIKQLKILQLNRYRKLLIAIKLSKLTDNGINLFRNFRVYLQQIK